MTRRQLRRIASNRLAMRVADVAEQFDRLDHNQKLRLMVEAPHFYAAVTHMVRMRAIAVEMSR